MPQFNLVNPAPGFNPNNDYTQKDLVALHHAQVEIVRRLNIALTLLAQKARNEGDEKAADRIQQIHKEMRLPDMWTKEEGFSKIPPNSLDQYAVAAAGQIQKIQDNQNKWLTDAYSLLIQAAAVARQVSTDNIADPKTFPEHHKTLQILAHAAEQRTLGKTAYLEMKEQKQSKISQAQLKEQQEVAKAELILLSPSPPFEDTRWNEVTAKTKQDFALSELNFRIQERLSELCPKAASGIGIFLSKLIGTIKDALDPQVKIHEMEKGQDAIRESKFFNHPAMREADSTLTASQKIRNQIYKGDQSCIDTLYNARMMRAAKNSPLEMKSTTQTQSETKTNTKQTQSSDAKGETKLHLRKT